MKPDQAITIVQLESYINNHQTTGSVMGTMCHPGFWKVGLNQPFLHAGSQQNMAIFPLDNGYYIFQTPPGKVQLNALYCTENKVLAQKQRQHLFNNPPSFEAEAGRINYAGKIKVNYWTSDGNIGDLFNAAQNDSDDDRIQMKVLDDYKRAQEFFLGKYKKLPEGFTFKKSLLNKSGLSD